MKEVKQDLRYDVYSLRQIIDDLRNELPGILEVYLFGSRRHRTRSTRSDVDILVQASASTRPEEVRVFAIEHCPALDIFLINGAIAISCANNSQVKGFNRGNLIRRLDAVLLWEENRGFTKADVDWEFQVIKGQNRMMMMMMMMMMTLVTSVPYLSKAEAISTLVCNPSVPKPLLKWSDIRDHPISIIAFVDAAACGLTFTAIYNTRIVPLEKQIEAINKRHNSVNTNPMTPSARRSPAVKVPTK
jgi:predicted nucleotidyltransferase